MEHHAGLHRRSRPKDFGSTPPFGVFARKLGPSFGYARSSLRRRNDREIASLCWDQQCIRIAIIVVIEIVARIKVIYVNLFIVARCGSSSSVRCDARGG